MRLQDRFERIYVVNLRSRADRRREVSAQLARLGLSFDHPQVRLFEAVRPDHPGGFDSVGARGCFMSHYGVLRDAAALQSVLLLEDDLDFDDDVALRLPRALKALPQKWGIFYGGARVQLEPEAGPAVRVDSHVRISTSHFVAFAQPVVRDLTAYLGMILERPAGHPEGGPMHVDGAYQRFRIDHPEVETYVACPELGHQRASRTDIHALRWFDRWRGVRDAAGALRRWRR